MRILFVLLFTMMSRNASSIGSVEYLEVDNNVVLFSTSEPKSGARPTCVNIANSGDLWAISLATESGRAVYSLILTAMAKGNTAALNIESANNCQDKDGIESASKVSVGAVSEPVSDKALSHSIGLYRADGISRIGTVLSMGIERNSWYYVTEEASSETLFLQNEADYRAVYYYFKSDDCTGTPYISTYENIPIFNTTYDNGNAYISDGPSSSEYARSRMHEANGYCHTYSSNTVLSLYKIKPYEHEICGQGKCVIRQD